MFVIRRDDGKYVAWPGGEHSYTNSLENAQCFAGREEAERSRCGNEHIVPVSGILAPRK